MKKNISTFIGCDNEYEESSIAIWGAPFDATTSFRPGTRFASAAIRRESYGIETYSPYLDMDLEDAFIFDCGDLELPFGNVKKALKMIEDHTTHLLDDGKIPGMIGGEHLVTLGAFRAVLQKYPDTHVIQFDAHCDLRNDYLGEPLSHATVIRRIHDLTGDGRIYQFGIRSGERSEFQFGKQHTFLNKYDFTGLREVIKQLDNQPVYFTLDLDVLDPSIFPGTGTPEAGGVSFSQLNETLALLRPLNIVGFDINELSPPYDQSGISTAAACKVLRELLLIVNQEEV